MYESDGTGKKAIRGENESGRSAARRPYWLISNHRGGYVEALTVEFGGVKVLPIFSFEEEAGLFLSLGVSQEGWKVRRSGAGEILSLLHGPCSDVDGVALDPMPEINGDSLLKLVTIEKEEFEATILGVSPIASVLARLPA